MQLDRNILALPVRLGVRGMTNPCLEANFEQSSSVKVTTPLVQQIVAQSYQMPDDSLVKSLQQAVRSERANAFQDRAELITGNVRSGKVRQYTIFHWLLKKGCGNAIYAPIGLFRGALREGLVFASSCAVLNKWVTSQLLQGLT